MLCPHKNHCKLYSDTSVTCNRNGGVYYEDRDAGCKRKMDNMKHPNKLKLNFVLALAFVLSFVFMVGGFVGAVDINQCATLGSANGIYDLTSSFINDSNGGSCLYVSANNVTLNCHGYTVNLTANATLLYSFKTNTVIRDCIFYSSANSTYYGLEFYSGANNGIIHNNSIYFDNNPPIYLYRNLNNTISNNIINSSSSTPIYNIQSNFTLISNNNINAGSGTGSYFDTSYNITFSNNNVTSTNYPVYLYKSQFFNINNNNILASSNAGMYIYLSNNNLLNHNLVNSSINTGIYIKNSINNTLLNNIINTNYTGIAIESSNYTNISNNYAYSISKYGIDLYNSNFNYLYNNTGIGLDSYGIGLRTSSSFNNLLSNYGQSTSNNGISVSGSFNNILNGNLGNSSLSIGIYSENSGNVSKVNNRGYGRYGIEDNNMVNSFIDNNTILYSLVSAIFVKNSNNLTISNSIMSFVDRGIRIEGSQNINVSNNIVTNCYSNYDSYNNCINIEYNNSNINVFNNNLSNYGSNGIFIRQSNNVSIFNNYIDSLPLSSVNSINWLGTKQSPDPNSAVGILELYYGSLGKGSSFDIGNIDNVSQYASTDINIYNNTYGGNVQTYVQSQGTSNLIINEKWLNNYWIASYQFPTSTVDKTELYNNNNFNNLTFLINRTRPNYYNGYLEASNIYTQAYPLIDGVNYNYTSYSISKNNLWFQNTNYPILIGLNLYSLTTALLHNTTSLCNGSTGLTTGNINITLNPNEYCYVLDNFNLTEGISRQYSPIWFSSSSPTEKHIASNLSETITTTVVMDVRTCSNIGNIKQTSPSGYGMTYQNGYFSKDYTCENNQVTILNVLLEPSSESNEFIISYDCDTYTKTGNMLIILFTSIGVMAIMLVFVKIRGGITELELKDVIMMFMIAVLGVIFYLTIAQTIGASCPVS